MRTALTYFIIILIACKLGTMLAIFYYPVITTGTNSVVDSAELIRLTNQYRQVEGLEPLIPNARLTQAAVNKARDLLSRQYFNHTTPDGKRFSTWIKDVNYQYFYVGENLAVNFHDNQTLFQAWIDSPKHFENIINPHYQEIGIAALEGKFQNQPTVMVVQMFGSRIAGATEEAGTPAPVPANIEPSFITTLVPLRTLDHINYWLNYGIIIAIGGLVITYRPQRTINQTSIKTPIITRYQTKTARE
jgi:hypothetical protein